MQLKRIETIALAFAVGGLVGCTEPRTTDEPTESSVPRGVILFIGDGMGVSTVTAARIFAGQLAGGPGEEHSLSFEGFPHVALIKTYNVDAQVPDSAGTMTAIVTGEKTRAGVLSVSAEVERGDCAAGLAQPLTTLLERAEEAGFATGVVSTATITHATPAAAYAHAADRNWEDDSALPEQAAAQGCRDIARQLIEFNVGDGIEVALGGGRGHFLPIGEPDPEYPEQNGFRADGRNLVAEWLAGEGRAYAWNLEQLLALQDLGSPQCDGSITPKEQAAGDDAVSNCSVKAASSARQVLGLFEPSHMQFEVDRAEEAEPSLADMTEFALRRLMDQEPGFLLLVEGGRIDHAHHFGNAYRALHDTLALDAAVARAQAMTNSANTLILVTADHSHTLTISGYPRRGNPILGKVEAVSGEATLDERGHPYTTLGYANGPGWIAEPIDLSETDTEAADYRQTAAVPMAYETHGGEDVAAYASGPGAAGVAGVLEQNRLHDVLFEGLFGRRPALLGSHDRGTELSHESTFAPGDRPLAGLRHSPVGD